MSIVLVYTVSLNSRPNSAIKSYEFSSISFHAFSTLARFSAAFSAFNR